MVSESFKMSRAASENRIQSEAILWGVTGLLPGQEGVSRIQIHGNSAVFGRSAEVDIVLPSRNVSKRHAELIVTQSIAVVRDLGSTNGTFVNGRRILEPTPVDDGDHIQLADVELRVFRELPMQLDFTYVADAPETQWLLSRMNDVFRERRIRMFYQPIVDAITEQIFGYEALVRCDVPGLESPLTLFSTASKLGQECRLSCMCREEAVTNLSRAPMPGALFLNTDSKEELGAELIEHLKVIREAIGGRRMVLEVHEAAVPQPREFRNFAAALKDMDILLAFDDFGVGQSRLLELAEVQPDILKFDRSLVKDLGQPNARHASLVRNLHNSAVDLGICTLAEGVETVEAIAACREIGFQLFQGFAFGRPAPLETLSPASTI